MTGGNEKLLVPPQSIQAEQALIGALLIDGTAFNKVQSIVETQDFYRVDHRIIFEAISQLSAANQPVDLVTVSDYLADKGLLEKAGGKYVVSLANDTPSAANAKAYAELVQEKSLLRAIIKTADELRGQAFESGSSREMISTAERAIFALAQRGVRSRRGFEPIKKTLSTVIDKMEADFENPPESGITGLPTGLVDLDQALNGLNPGNLIVIAARPSMGKTALAMNIAGQAAIKPGIPVAVFSMEMPREELAQRLMASDAEIPLDRIRKSWTIQEQDWTRAAASMVRLGPSPLYIDDTPGLSIGAVRSRSMRLVSEIGHEHPEGLGLIVVDYIQLMGSDVRGMENRNGQIEEITRGLKELAKELSVPVIALSQLNRNLESRPNKRPVMSDLRDSGSIEQDADIVLFPYRDEVYNADSADKGTAEIIVGKNRNGPLSVIRALFEGQYTRFRSLDKYGYAEEEY